MLCLHFLSAFVCAVSEFGLCSGSHELQWWTRSFAAPASFRPCCLLRPRIRPERSSKLVCVGAEGREFALSRLVGSTCGSVTRFWCRRPPGLRLRTPGLHIRKPSLAGADVYQVKAVMLHCELDKREETFRVPFAEITLASTPSTFLIGDSRLLLCRQSESAS